MGEPAPLEPVPGGIGRTAGADRRVLVRALAHDIERVSGIAVTGPIEGKLGRVLASVELAELAAWVGRLRLLPADHAEWLSLIESLTVHETFFHRDRAQLELLGRLMREVIAAAAADGRCRMRLWSAGCATGEEAYSLAIVALLALRAAGFADDASDGGIVCRPPWQVDVLGTDISAVVLTRATNAVYGSSEGLSAFRDLPAALRRFFPPLPPEPGASARRGVLPAIRRHVRFQHGNLANAAPPERGFDVVLCRNVLIYFTAAARIAAQRGLRRSLRPGGFLLLGPTDALAEPAAFEPRWSGGAVAHRLLKPAT